MLSKNFESRGTVHATSYSWFEPLNNQAVYARVINKTLRAPFSSNFTGTANIWSMYSSAPLNIFGSCLNGCRSLNCLPSNQSNFNYSIICCSQCVHMLYTHIINMLVYTYTCSCRNIHIYAGYILVIFWPSTQPKNTIPRWYTGR